MRTTTATALAASLLLLGLSACTTHTSSADNNRDGDVKTIDVPKTTPKPGKYEQTWSTPYSATTCGQFLTDMDEHQRWVTAADMLAGARKTDGANTLPADSEVDRFQTDMATACEPEATAKTTEIGATLYMLDPSYKP
ncbi:hypothetical protein OG384_14905 [Streptomyces sp. NBC_01324]|uniref:hypothetical protein n=1 Tax=Streptomyces sp. NBC_01324 TaxID=2903826 RepID=UPI002E153A03|nr:hypothetical protein OG384_14905 [Streptomyces sp. NBC_01324]